MAHPKRQAIIKWAAGVLLALVVAYPLSYGPVAVVHENRVPKSGAWNDPRDPVWVEHEATRKKIELVYEPFFVLLRHSDAARELNSSWMLFWYQLVRR